MVEETSIEESQFKPGVLAIILIAACILLLIILFIVGKRQIMRFAQKFPTDGPHAPIGYDAPKKLALEIERRLNVVKQICFEPKLLDANNELASEANIDRYKHIYRMKVVDSVKQLEEELVRACGNEDMRRPPGQDLRVYLMTLRCERLPLARCDSKLINQFVESYTNARCDPIPDFGPEEYHHFMTLLERIRSSIVCRAPLARVNSTTSSTCKRKSSKTNSSGQVATFKSHISNSSPIKMSTVQTTHIVHKDDNNKGIDSETRV